MNSHIRLLLIEDNSDDADLIRTHLVRKHGSHVQIVWAKRLAEGLERLAIEPFDAVLLDLGLPDSNIDTTLEAVLHQTEGTKGIPVIVLSALEDEEFAVKAVHQGAQDYLCKSQLNGELLFRSIQYSFERKSTEETLRSALRAKDEFLATLSHELRTPISIIHGFAELASQSSLSESDRNHALETILRHSRHQVRLIDDLLDMSRMITGQLVLQSQEIELAPILRASIETVQLAAGTKQIALRTIFDTPAGLVQADPVRIQQIVWNLLSNAIKFTPPGGEIVVRLRRVQSRVQIDVEDTGEGIDPDFMPFVFDRFRQQDSSKSRHFGGLGLGLAIVRDLVELHGGQVSASSAGIGKGSTFSVSLPLTTVKIDAPAEVPREAKSTSQESAMSIQSEPAKLPLLNGVHVMAIDDSSDTLVLVDILLRRHGATVSTAKSSAEALDLLDTLNPDVIVCDIGMPDEDGHTFISKMRALETTKGRNHTPTIALTAYAREEDRQKAYRSGFKVYLVKPVEERTLVKTIAGLASRRKDPSPSFHSGSG